MTRIIQIFKSILKDDVSYLPKILLKYACKPAPVICLAHNSSTEYFSETTDYVVLKNLIYKFKGVEDPIEILALVRRGFMLSAA